MRIISKVTLVLLIIMLLSPQTLFAEANSKFMKDSDVNRELRGAWISTVYNIDWPSKPGLSIAKQQKEYVAMLDKLKSMGINTVFVQVRAASDAIYPSKTVPWARSLTGTEGKDPGYDPLDYMIKETHKRGMEFHAWFNPFRASTASSLDSLSINHPARQHPQWVIKHDNKLIYDPGNPEVRQHIIKAIMEVVKNYDIDGVHLDDYFYPYGNNTFKDQQSFAAYRGTTEDKASWRRNNVNEFVRQLSQSIRAENKNIEFGISPFGIWRNQSKDSTGSATNGNSAYDSQYADARTWIKKGWIDYVAPQLYWSIGYKPANYEVLVAWWSKEVKGSKVKLYVGHGPYRLNSNKTDWASSDAIIRQLQLNQNYPEVEGSIFFSAKTLTQNKLNIGNELTEFYKKSN
ncbi:glycoside hydrolase family 10 protein [Paenibacillus medicaginis]|uniref:Glycoside hydrolase family 10 protein n=1 Tax=Paenibacillus medicaginis TaxID=1470560 RepID=A0ABV5C1G3_9BACL